MEPPPLFSIVSFVVTLEACLQPSQGSFLHQVARRVHPLFANAVTPRLLPTLTIPRGPQLFLQCLPCMNFLSPSISALAMSPGCAAEIERTLKRVEEGIAAFDEQLERVHEADSQALKERHEEELKKEIKKLQRYRDAIKIWQNGSDVKQKQPLIDARAAIERRMETFKMVERETKTKAYSKEGLARDNTLTAEEKKRLRTREWVQELVQQLSDDADATEAEVEALETAAATAGGGAKAKKDREATLTRLNGIITNHRWHIDRLEALTRMLDNERVDPDEVDAIRDDLSYYVEQVRPPTCRALPRRLLGRC